jgi:hypothetical protein
VLRSLSRAERQVCRWPVTPLRDPHFAGAGPACDRSSPLDAAGKFRTWRRSPAEPSRGIGHSRTRRNRQNAGLNGSASRKSLAKIASCARSWGCTTAKAPMASQRRRESCRACRGRRRREQGHDERSPEQHRRARCAAMPACTRPPKYFTVQTPRT